MENRLTTKELFETLNQWSRFIKKKVHLIACGGTAMTLLKIKASTKDVDFMIPNIAEHAYIKRILNDLSYKPARGIGLKRDNELYVFDLFCGNKIHTTELLKSPLEKENHIFIKNIGNIYLGALNYYDLIVSKIMRAAQVDFDDCELLYKVKKDEIDINVLRDRYRETCSYDVSEHRIKGYIDSFIARVNEVDENGK
ncbi:MAG: hypothetical protein A2Y03_00650 [Omnitrophica WOR_2 bacterium GWF2_38_59]|nr:MAG: hypothetical protein A2Y03_00650 [Omnitrophica WOR_2 bacterium GWF2_38_59]OGX49513.1 MAG: hypothetical protein A2243_10555 [Omnitrophica WOR_2 bacterium RIFOXYA2_FULL_38_17]OGX51309.1 MAG: hypothetical protein A2267_05900 [Omnitrophica WOR_2 bacterium RIFOXYA12_FULL_38_10]OGX58709.1 MAG: hypothetical protein A2306_12180 [Omnitrophica WOR_2 bacterium RIFOXYB2_FULL_38_16]HBG62182.1 hypothetical protein [Candidatus Omnitrophota bacterium]